MQTNRAPRRQRRSFAIIIALAAAPLYAAAATPITPIIRTGDPIPGGGAAGDTFVFFGRPSINANGIVGFRSQSKSFGEFTIAPGGVINRIAVGNEPAPGVPPGSNFALFDESFPINSHGEIAFSASADGNWNGWSTAGGTLQNTIAVGDPLPGHPTGGTFTSFGSSYDSVVLTESGASAYYAWTSTYPSSAQWGIWEGLTKGTTVKIALADDPAPTLGANTFYSNIDSPVINSSGVLAFHATVKGSGTISGNRELIWSGTPGNIRPVVRSKSLAPGATTNFATFYSPDISSSGKVAFHATLDFFATPSGQADGIWAGTAGNLTLLARSGFAAPGAGGATFSSRFGDPLINATGTVSFTNQLNTSATVTSANYAGLWAGTSANNLTLVARTGDHAPDTADGVNFVSPSDFAHVLNNLGEIAFTASLTGTGVNSTNDTGLWIYDPFKGTHLVVREGQSIDVAPGVSKTISSIALRTGASSGDGRATSLNDNGQIAFTAGFADSIYYGVFVANIGGTYAGDANQDGTVDIKDFAIMMNQYGKSGTFATGDFNADGQVNFSDFQIFEHNFGKSSLIAASDMAAASSVPEPATTAVLSIITTAALLRRRGNRGSNAHSW